MKTTDQEYNDKSMNRRNFLAMTGAGAGLMATGAAASAKSTSPIPPKIRKGLKKIKIGLYTISYSGHYYKGDALSFEDICKRAKQYGYDNIELDNKRPNGNPMDLSADRRKAMRDYAGSMGLSIPVVAANNDFTSPVPELQENQLLMVRETARLAKDVGAKIVRVHFAWPGLPIHNGQGTYDFGRPDQPTAGIDYYSFQRQYPYCNWLDRWHICKRLMKEAAKMGEEFGIVMALQNHKPLMRTWKDTLDMVQEIDSPWLKVCLDLPIMENRDDKEYVENAVRSVGKDLLVHSHFGGEYFRTRSGAVEAMVPNGKPFNRSLPDYSHYLGLLADIGYEGSFAYELCHPVLNKDLTPANVEFAHEQIKLAQLYIRNILNG